MLAPRLLLMFGLALARPNAKDQTVNVNMNGEYLISNPNTFSSKQFSTQYSTYPNVKYFDAYSPPIQSRYGEVYWTMMDPVPLDKHIVDQFHGKTMAIVGYESDQVMKTDDGDVSVPIIWAYNHHFEAYLSGSYSEMTEVDGSVIYSYKDILPRGMNSHKATKFSYPFPREDLNDPTPDSHIPISQFFSEGNGGEFRKSYHGYPHGFAQLIDSPTTFHIQPMQIDTRNRDYNGSDFRAGMMPKASAAPPNASYSGLLECPCTTRIPKVINVTYSTANTGQCNTPVHDAKECFSAAAKVDPSGAANATHHSVNSKDFPSGCYFVKSKDGATAVYFNSYEGGAECGAGDSQWMGELNTAQTKVGVSVHLDGSTAAGLATITLSGPGDKWFGVGFGAPSFGMKDEPYSIIVDGAGKIQERKIGNHDGGVSLSSSVTLVSNKVVSGVRTVVVTRPFKGATADHYTFDPKTASSIPVLTASGMGADFAYHGPKLRSGATMQMAAINAATCICNAGITGTINGVPFHKNCLPEPRGDLLQQKNPTCWVQTYQGGLSCCHHEVVLLDKHQIQPPEVMTYHLKFRFYYQPYEPATPTKPTTHQNLIRLYYQTEADAGEYDIPKCDAGTPPEMCIHEITARWQVKDMVSNCDTRKNPSCSGNTTDYDGVHLIYAGGHCHAPTCVSMDLYNADTGKLLCHHSPVYGKSHKVFDEEGYIAIPPCLWGPQEEGLVPPTFLAFDTNLLSVKRNNNTNAHYGEMASWQMRGVLVKKPAEV